MDPARKRTRTVGRPAQKVDCADRLHVLLFSSVADWTQLSYVVIEHTKSPIGVVNYSMNQLTTGISLCEPVARQPATSPAPESVDQVSTRLETPLSSWIE